MPADLADLLRKDLEAAGLAPSSAASTRGFSHHTGLAWVAGDQVPRARKLRRFLAANGLALHPYETFLRAPQVVVVCPSCPGPRLLSGSRFAQAVRRVAG